MLASVRAPKRTSPSVPVLRDPLRHLLRRGLDHVLGSHRRTHEPSSDDRSVHRETFERLAVLALGEGDVDLQVSGTV